MESHTRLIEYYGSHCVQYKKKKTYKITGGVLQGSVLGPDLWNTMYDALLRLPLPERATTIGFADDDAVVFVGKFLSRSRILQMRPLE